MSVFLSVCLCYRFVPGTLMTGDFWLKKFLLKLPNFEIIFLKVLKKKKLLKERKNRVGEESVPNVTCHLSHVVYHLLPVTCHLSPVTFHLSPTPTATDLPLLTPPLCTVGWYAKKKPNPKQKSTLK